ncbi:MAG: replication-associated recombination protein A [Clostridia bacterium]|nr:replication-associated recombination protein A [Clostridia bacterium]
MKSTPLAELIRPQNFDEIVGQQHLFGPRGAVRRMCESGRITNMIFYGPPGTGKTTAAAVIAKYSDMSFARLNATTASLSDVKEVLASTENVFGSGGVLLYLDEIQYFNRKQQQTLLEYIEDGRVTLIASTTENPHFYVYNALISRSALFEFKPVPPSETVRALRRALDYLNRENNTLRTSSDEILFSIASSSGGDVRRAILLFENSYYHAEGTDAEITADDVTPFESGITNYNDDTHYDLLSALQKSIRGSDPDAAVFYLCRLLAMGELISACRRLQVIASEDVGLAYPMAAAITRACCESAKELGMPEARIPLSHAAALLATAPKSNSAYLASAAAAEDIEAGRGAIPPVHLQSPLFKGYRYPHDFPNHYVHQQYLPDDLKDKIYYKFGQNKTEQAAAAYAESIGSRKKGS